MPDQILPRRSLLGVVLAAGGSLAAGAAWLVVPTRLLAQTLGQTAVKTPPAAKPTARRRTVVLDPGHGGIDPGAIGLSGVYEKDLALDAARLVARQLEASKRYRVVLTRTSDEFVALQDRVARARAADGDLFLSIHADALPDPGMRGASVFTLSEKASDKEAAALAARENKVDLIAGIDLSRHAPEVSSILIDLARRQTNNQSIRLARRLVNDLGQDVRMLNNSHRSAGFAVLKAPDIPSALVEMGCLSNRQEEHALRLPSYRQKVAIGIARSINDYFDSTLKA
jgi:N-acetylmuramoyl-L-alanine amidase